MPRKKKKSGNPITGPLLVLSLLVAALGVYSYIRFRPVSPAEIFQIEVTPLSEGQVTLSGTFQKDAAVGDPGTYLLVLPDGRPVQLDFTEDMDFLLGSTVTVEGTLTLPAAPYDLPYLFVTKLTGN